MAEELEKDFYNRCSYQCLKENYDNTVIETKTYEEMINRYEEMGIQFLTREQIQIYISEILKPRLRFIRRHVIRVAKSEEEFPDDVI